MSNLFGALLLLAMVVYVRWIGLETQSDQLLVGAGLLLVFSYLAGKGGKRIRLPTITGYLLLGVVVGPSVTGLFSQEMVAKLQLVNDLAVSLIALTAGAEIKMSWLRARAKSIAWIMAMQNGLLFVLMSVALFLARGVLPFMTQNWHIDLVISIVLGAFSVASSPSVAVAMITEMRARGPLSQTVLGVTVLKDVAVVMLFTLAVALGRAVLAGADIDGAVAWDLIRETFGSVALGILIGIGMAFYLWKIGQEVPLVLVSVCFLIAELGSLLHTEPLIMGMTAGFFLRNVWKGSAETLIDGLERLSLPVYCLFFGLAGLGLKVGSLSTLGIWALIYVGFRLSVLWFGTLAGARISGAEPAVARYSWLGFVSQAGVTLAMANNVARTFPSWGPAIQALTVTFIAVNQLIGPPLFKYALTKSKEARET